MAPMIMAILIPTVIFTLVGIAAVAWGVDSRPTLGDDHAR